MFGYRPPGHGGSCSCWRAWQTETDTEKECRVEEPVWLEQVADMGMEKTSDLEFDDEGAAHQTNQ